jgi:glycine betaine/proline transport system substrate-binding protein
MTTRSARHALVAFMLVSLTLLAGTASASDHACPIDRTIVFADFDWDSAMLLNGIARTILEEGFGCTTDAFPGSTIPMYQAAIRGDIDVLMEVSKVNVPDFWPGALADGSVVELTEVFDDAIQGFYVPRYVIEGDAERGIEPSAPDLRSVSDLPRYAELFRDPEQPDRGRLHNCILGWQCELINTVKFYAYGLDETYVTFEPGTAVALATSMETAYLRREPWVGYYWSPTWLLGRLDMVLLEEPPYTDACWDAITEHFDTPEQAEVACAYPAAAAAIVVGAAFNDEADARMLDFLAAMRVPTDTISELLAHMQETGSDTLSAARSYLAEQPEAWTHWVDASIAERVLAALD